MVKQNNKQKGFTLVELAIVIVIIGLIVGGVLVGQDLIKAAQVRAVVTQIQGYDAAINTFRTKYDGLPGDLTRANAFGLNGINAANTANGTGSGNGNGTINTTGSATVFAFDEEALDFWIHLSSANLVAGSYTDATAAAPALGGAYPDNKLKKGGVVAFNDGTSLNFWGIGATGDGTTYSAGITPVEAFGIDSKLDDGFPVTGIVQARDGGVNVAATTFTAADDSTASCGRTGTVVEYKVPLQDNRCALKVRISG